MERIRARSGKRADPREGETHVANADKHTEGTLQILPWSYVTSKAGLFNMLHLEQHLGRRKINNTNVGKMCRRAHQDVMFIKVQQKWEMSALNSLAKRVDVDKVVHYSFCWARRQTNKKTKQPNKRSGGYRWKPGQGSQWGHRQRDPQDLTLRITIQQRLEN